MSEMVAEAFTFSVSMMWLMALVVFVVGGWHSWIYRFLLVGVPITILWYKVAYKVIKE